MATTVRQNEPCSPASAGAHQDWREGQMDSSGAAPVVWNKPECPFPPRVPEGSPVACTWGHSSLSAQPNCSLWCDPMGVGGRGLFC